MPGMPTWEGCVGLDNHIARSMEAPKDVVALFHSSFHPTRGNIVDFQLKIRDDVNLDGVEFSSLPSGLHLVDQDVMFVSPCLGWPALTFISHFTKDGLCGIAVFRRRRTKENGLRGVRLGAVGVLIGSAPRARPWLHLPHLKRLAAHLEDTPEDWVPLTEYFEAHRQPDIVSADSSIDVSDIWSGWEHELATASPNHPLHHLPCLLHAFGPSIMTLFRFVLARRRVLIYTRVPVSPSRSASFNSLASRLSESTRPDDGSRGNSIDQTAAEVGAAPVVEPACVLARVAADICFGWRSEMDVPGLASAAEGAIPVLGMVGLDSIEKLGEETMKKTGWIACTTERIFLEKPHLYDLVVDLSPSLLAHSPQTKPDTPDDKPVLSVSVPTSSGSTPSLLSTQYKLAPTRPTFSDLRVFGDIERALYAQPECSHQSTDRPNNRSAASLGCGCPGEHEVEEGWVVWDRWGQGCTSSTHAHFSNSYPANPGMLITGNRQSCAAGMNTGPCSSGLNGHTHTESGGNESSSRSIAGSTTGAAGTAGLKTWIDPWKIYEDVCMFCAGVCTWIGQSLSISRNSPNTNSGEGVRLQGPDDALTRRSQHQSPASAEERRSRRRAHVLELMTIFHKYAAFLHARLGDIVDSYDALPQSPRKIKASTGSKSTLSTKSIKSAFSSKPLIPKSEQDTLVLTSRDMVALELSPLSASDAQFLEWLAECVLRSIRKGSAAAERKVVVKRTWRDMVVAVVGSSW
ncbi:Protein LCHN [Ceratobasidium theobromae]|uniref:Protein LCHN n=1 Tax=Ceratobasidium theobromae TaxID=1582974 RepID=A0A5N5QFL8_9AGAM|nr:Protein LCHN [Ceratobasidium theobromae]